MSKLTAAEQKKVDTAEAEKLKAEEEAKAAEAEKLKAEEEAKAAEAKASKTGITVKNLRKTWFVQPSTQTRIGVGAEVLIANDGWAQNQINAGFFEVVK